MGLLASDAPHDPIMEGVSAVIMGDVHRLLRSSAFMVGVSALGVIDRTSSSAAPGGVFPIPLHT